jgi:hypothetical protein
MLRCLRQNAFLRIQERKEQKKEQKLAMMKKARDVVKENHKRAEEKTWNSDSDDEDEVPLQRELAMKHILFWLRKNPTYSKCTFSDIGTMRAP